MKTLDDFKSKKQSKEAQIYSDLSKSSIKQTKSVMPSMVFIGVS